MARPDPPLILNLTRTREALARMIRALEANTSLSVSQEQQLRRGRRALKKIGNEYLPWARSPAFTEAQAAGVRVWLQRVWKQLPLEEYEED